VNDLFFRIKFTALLISSRSGPIFKIVDFFCALKSLTFCLFPFNVGPGPIAQTLILGLKAWASALVKYHREFYETE